MDHSTPDTVPNPETRTPPAGEARRPAPPPPQPTMGATFLQSCLVAGCASVLTPIVLAFGFFLLLFALLSAGMSDASTSFDSLVPISASANLREKLIRQGRDGAGTIAIVSVHGIIDGGGSPVEGEGALAFVSEQLRAASEDKRVKAVILQIDSPGGGLTASDQLYNEVLELKAKNKIVLAWAGGLMASGGYYIAVGSDGIMATPTSTIGSIGVIMQHLQFRELLDKIGVKADPIVSGERKDIGSPFREMTPEERELLQEYIDTAHRRFVSVVAKGRGMEEEAVAELADGGFFMADAALEKGLIDRVGYIADALKWAEEKAGEKDMRVVSYKRLLSFGEIFREAGRGAASAVVESAAENSHPRAMAVMEGK